MHLIFYSFHFFVNFFSVFSNYLFLQLFRVIMFSRISSPFHAWKSKIRVKSYELRVQIHELRVRIYDLRDQIHELEH